MDISESCIAPSLEAASDDFASPCNFSTAEERAYWLGVADGLARAGHPVPPGVAARAGPPAGPSGEAGPRERHDAFSGAKKQRYLQVLAKTGCKLDACRIADVSSSTVYKHERDDPEFDRQCRLALAMSATPIELTAYERGVVGVEEDVIRGGKVVGTRIRRSDYMLRVLLQGSNPKKYGPRPGFTRKRLLKFERRQIEREVRARIAAESGGSGEKRDAKALFDDLAARLAELECEESEARRAAGWTDLGGGVSVPPGWVWAGEGDPVESLAESRKKSDAVYNSSNSSTSPAPNLSPPPGIP